MVQIFATVTAKILVQSVRILSHSPAKFWCINSQDSGSASQYFCKVTVKTGTVTVKLLVQSRSNFRYSHSQNIDTLTVKSPVQLRSKSCQTCFALRLHHLNNLSCLASNNFEASFAILLSVTTIENPIFRSDFNIKKKRVGRYLLIQVPI